MKTGFGVHQFTAIQECNKAKMDLKREGIITWLIGDGGIQHPRDACIGLAAGADMIMMGSLFAKTVESAGRKFVKIDGEYKEIEITEKTDLTMDIYSHYRGQASLNFMKSYYGSSKSRTAEGVDFYVKTIGRTSDIIEEYGGSLRSSMTYAGAENMADFRDKVVFFRSTVSYMGESNHRTEVSL
jgi:IMP dehydrogenase